MASFCVKSKWPLPSLPIHPRSLPTLTPSPPSLPPHPHSIPTFTNSPPSHPPHLHILPHLCSLHRHCFFPHHRSLTLEVRPSKFDHQSLTTVLSLPRPRSPPSLPPSSRMPTHTRYLTGYGILGYVLEIDVGAYSSEITCMPLWAVGL